MAGAQCMSFKYHMMGRGIGSLKINQMNEGTLLPKMVWSRVADQGDDWMETRFNLFGTIYTVGIYQRVQHLPELGSNPFFRVLQLKSNVPAYSVCVTYIRIQGRLMIVLITYFQCGLGNALIFKSNVDGENRELILAVVLIIPSKGHCYHNPDTLLPCIQV